MIWKNNSPETKNFNGGGSIEIPPFRIVSDERKLSLMCPILRRTAHCSGAHLGRRAENANVICEITSRREETFVVGRRKPVAGRATFAEFEDDNWKIDDSISLVNHFF